MKTFAILGVVILVATSCIQVPEKKDLQEFTIKIVISTPLGQHGDEKLPGSIDSLLMPMESKSCPDIAFVPVAELIRTGIPAEFKRAVITERKSWKSFFQKVYGNTSFSLRRMNAEEALRRITLDNPLIEAGLAEFDYGQSYLSLLENHPEAACFVYDPALSFSSVEIGNRKVPVCKSAGDLLTTWDQALCGKTITPDQTIYVLYQPVLGGPGPKQKSPETIPVSTPDVPEPHEAAAPQEVKVAADPAPRKVVDQTPKAVSEKVIETSSTTIRFENGDVYKGEVQSGKPHGNGVLTISKSRVISENDLTKQKADDGDYLVGVWKKGELQTAKLYDSTGKYKRTIIIGSSE